MQQAYRPPSVAVRTLRLIACLAILSGAFYLLFLTGDYSLPALQRQEHRLARLETEIEALRAQNERLKTEVRRLESDPAYVEKIARERYGMIKPGETVYRISDFGLRIAD